MTSRKIIREILIFLALSAILFLLNFDVIFDGLRAGPFVRVDGGTHIALGQHYARHIFPSVWGWADGWFGGMPFPQFYPPLFFIFLAVVSKLFFWVSYPALFTGIEFLMLAAVPYAIGKLGARISRNLFWSVSLSVAFLLSTNVFGPGGITVDSVLTIGLVPQLFGFLMLIGWIFFRNSRFVGSTLFLAAALFSNVPIAHLALLLMIGYWVGDLIKLEKCTWRSIYQATCPYLIQGSLALLCISVWLFPLITHYTYVAGVSLTPFYSLSSYVKWSPVFAVLAWLVWQVGRKKHFAHPNLFSFSIVALATAGFSFINFYNIIPSVPVHFYRCFTPAMILAVIPFFYFMRHKKWLQGVGVFFFFMLWIWSVPSMRNGAQEVQQARIDAPKIAALTDPVSGSGKYLVETIEGGKAMNYFLSSPEYGDPALKSVYNVLIESALNSMFYAPLRSSFGVGDSEVYSGISFLNNDIQFKSQSFDTHIRQAFSMGVKYIVSYSKILTLRLAESDLVTRKTSPQKNSESGWSLFTLKETPPQRLVSLYEPFLVYDRMRFKERSIDFRDFTRLGEELLFRNYFPDNGGVPLAIANHSQLDTSEAVTERGKFGGIVISHYNYTNFEKAKSEIETYAQSNPVILLTSNDPLYDALSGKNIYKIDEHFAKWQGPQYPPLREEYRRLFALVDEKKIRTSVESMTAYTIIKQSYFPGWVTKDGSPVYMIAPAFTMTSDPSSELVWQTPPSVKWGAAASVFGLILLFWIATKKNIPRYFLTFPEGNK